MSELSPILDYASPRKRSKFRMASASVLRVTQEEGGVQVVETLTGQAVAVGAIIFFLIAGTMMCVAGAEAGWVALAVLILVVGLPGLVVIPLVIQENWRRTELTVEPVAGELRLRFRAPLRSREYRWPLSAVLSISVGLTQAQEDAPVLGEIEVVAEGSPMIKLFTDHGERELVLICDMLNEAMASRSPPDGTA